MAKSGSSASIPPSSGSSMPGGSSGSMGSSGSSGSGGMGSTFPDLSLSSKAQDPDSSVLKGFDSVAEGKSPSEERLGGEGMLAKVEPSESSERQVEEIRREQAQEQAASAQAGLNNVFFGYDSWTISEDGRQALMQDAEADQIE